jgi:two-component system chemotaxis sensor kinase CheA
VIEHLKDPLMHMIRNAIDHGIESIEKRQALGKDPCGRLTLKAYRDGGNIVIQVIDDGAGLDRSRIIERARRMNILSEPEELADPELFRLIFGWFHGGHGHRMVRSRCRHGRLRRNIEALRGSVTIESQLGLGTTITLRLPLTLAIIEGFGVGVGNETYVLPLHAVVECVPMPPNTNPPSGQGIMELRGEPLPYIRLRDWFKLPRANPRRENIVVVEVDQTRAGLAVDALYGARQTVIKPLGKPFESLTGIAGSAILGNGRVALIIDVAGLVRAVMRSQGNAVAPSRDLVAPKVQSGRGH